MGTTRTTQAGLANIVFTLVCNARAWMNVLLAR